MPEKFQYDVFLSHSSKDKEEVRPLAKRLQQDGLRVWLDEGLEQSRVLVLCMSANTFGSDWAKLESGTFRFRDPLNKERRFLPLRLDDAPIKGSLAQFLYINWLPPDREQEYAKLLEACQLTAKLLMVEEEVVREQNSEKVQLDYDGYIFTYAFSPDGKLALTGNSDQTVRLWDMETGRCVRVLKGHGDHVVSVAWSTDQCRALSGAGRRDGIEPFHRHRVWYPTNAEISRDLFPNPPPYYSTAYRRLP